MRMSNIFETEEVDGKVYMVCLDSDVLAGMVELNETAAFIVNNLADDTTEENVAQKMCEEYEISYEEALQGVCAMVDQLKQINAIEE